MDSSNEWGQPADFAGLRHAAPDVLERILRSEAALRAAGLSELATAVALIESDTRAARTAGRATPGLRRGGAGALELAVRVTNGGGKTRWVVDEPADPVDDLAG
jgi:hypothetical protein